MNCPGSSPGPSSHLPGVMLPRHELPKNWHTSTVQGGGLPHLPPLRLVLPKRTEYPCLHCSPRGEPASVPSVGSVVRTHLLLLLILSPVLCDGPSGEPVCTPLKWGRDRGTTLTPCGGQVFQSSPVGHLHARRRVNIPCFIVSHGVVLTTQIYPPSVLLFFSRVRLLGDLATYTSVLFSLLPLPWAGNELLLTRH